MPKARLYLYRKAGREIWDAEMWLPDGRRRVWRTGIVERDAAEGAARARLEALAASPAMGASAVSDDVSGVPVQVVSAVTAPVEAATEPTMNAAESVDLAKQTTPAGEEQAVRATWSERFDRWFFGELAALMG
jgi:hypothetical protein